jgi:type IV pilus assembly protein PilV
MTASPFSSRQSGFSLIEVLVTLLIISIGLLGVAKMQALSIGNTKTASSRAIAAIHAASLSSAMYANKVYWGAGLAPASVQVNGTVLTNSTLNGQATDCVNGTCTPVQMAGYDLKAWGAALQQLPSGVGGVTCSTALGSPISCSVTVSWNEKYIGLNQSSLTAAQQTSTQSLVLLVQP